MQAPFPKSALPKLPRGRPPGMALPAQQLDRVCCALAHRARRRLLDTLRHSGPQTASRLHGCFPLVRANAICAHLKVLRAAGLVMVGVLGDMRERVYALTPAAGDELRDWLGTLWPGQLDASRLRELAKREQQDKLLKLAEALGEMEEPG